MRGTSSTCQRGKTFLTWDSSSWLVSSFQFSLRRPLFPICITTNHWVWPLLRSSWYLCYSVGLSFYYLSSASLRLQLRSQWPDFQFSLVPNCFLNDETASKFQQHARVSGTRELQVFGKLRRGLIHAEQSARRWNQTYPFSWRTDHILCKLEFGIKNVKLLAKANKR